MDGWTFEPNRDIRPKNEKIRVTLCENAAGALYVVNKVCVLMVREMCKGETS